MPYDIPRPYGYRIQPFKLQDDEALVASMAQQLLKARLAEARAAARGGGGGGRGGSGEPGKGKGEWIMRLDSATGRYKPVWVPGKAAKDREKNLKGLDYNETKDRIEKNPEVAKLLDTLRSPSASNLTKQESLKKLNALRSDPSFSGLDKEAVGAAVSDVVKPYASEVQEEKRKIESSGRLGALATSAKIAGEKFGTWLDELINGDSAPQVIERSKASLERQRALRESDPYLREQDLRSAEEPEMQRGWKERTGGYANAATNFGSDLLSDPGLGLALAGGAVATAGTGGLAAPLVGAALAATGGAMSSDIMLQERLAGDERLTDAERARAYEEGALQEKVIGAGLNVLPAVSPAAIRGIQIGRAAKGLAGAKAQAARASRAAELNRFGAQMKYNVAPASAEAAAVNAGQMAGSNWHYGSLTGQPVDPTEGVGQAAATGVLFGLGTGLGGAVRSARMSRNATPLPAAPQTPASPDGGTPAPADRDAFIQEALAQQEAEAQSKGKGAASSSQGGQTPPPAAPVAPQAPTPPAAPVSPAASQAPAPSAAPVAPQASTPAPSAVPTASQFAPRSAPNLTPEQMAKVPELQELSRYVSKARSKVWDKDPELAAARAMASGSTGDAVNVAGDWANARYAELLVRDEAKIRSSNGVKAYLKKRDAEQKAAIQRQAEVQEAMPSATRSYDRDSGVRSTPSDWNIEPVSLEDMQRRVAAERALANQRFYNRDSGVRSTPSNWDIETVTLEDMQRRVAAERKAKAAASASQQAASAPAPAPAVQPAPVRVPQGTANATLQATGIQPTANDLVNEVVKTFRGTAPKTTSWAAKASASAKGRKSASFDYKQLNTTLSDKELGFISTAGKKKDEAMDSLMPADLATQTGADEVLRILDQALDAQARGDSSKKLKNFIEGATRTLKYLQEIRNITPRREVPNAAGQPAAETAAPVQQPARVGEEGANSENSGADSGVAPDTGVPAEAPAGGAAPAVRVRRAKDKGVGDGRRAGGSTPAAPHSEGGPRTEGTGREPGGEGTVGKSSPEQPAAVVPKPSEGAGRTEPPAVAGDGSPAARGGAEEALTVLTADYLRRRGVETGTADLVNTAENRAKAIADLAGLADFIDDSPALARQRLEDLHRNFGLGKRRFLENMIRMTDDPHLQDSLKKVLTLFRPGEDEIPVPRVNVSERLNTFLSQPLERQRAVYDVLSSLTDMSAKEFQQTFGKEGENLVAGLQKAGFATPEDLAALYDAVHQQRVIDSQREAMMRRLTGRDEAPEVEVPAVREEEVSDPLAQLADGIEAAQTRMAELFKAAGARAQEARAEYVASLPTPERMSTLLNKIPGMRQFETGSDKWIEAAVPNVNTLVSLIRKRLSVERGDARWAQADADFQRMEKAGFTVDFFQSLVPGVDLFNTRAKAYEITANDLRNAYDPEGALRESIAAQKEGLPVCPS